jgi:hypothetical protein
LQGVGERLNSVVPVGSRMSSKIPFIPYIRNK